MKKIICRDDFWEMFPDCKIGIVVCKGIDNVYKENEAEYEALIRRIRRSWSTRTRQAPSADVGPGGKRNVPC